MTIESIEELDTQIAKLESELGKEDNSDSSYGSPSPAQKDNIFKFFEKILDSDDSRKTGNLDNVELGKSRLGVRSWLEIAAYAEAEGLDKVANYLIDKSEIIASTSMSKKGFLSQLFVTQIKKEQKVKEPTKIKKGLFGSKVVEND